MKIITNKKTYFIKILICILKLIVTMNLARIIELSDDMYV